MRRLLLSMLTSVVLVTNEGHCAEHSTSPVIPSALVTQLSSVDPQVRHYATKALELPVSMSLRTGQDTSSVILSAVVRQLSSRDRQVRHHAIRVLEPIVSMTYSMCWHWAGGAELQQYHRQIKPLLNELRALARHPDGEVRETVVQLIAGMGTEGSSAVNELKELVLDEREKQEIRWYALRAMFFVTPETIPVTPLILPAMDSIWFVGIEPDASSENTELAAFPTLLSSNITLCAVPLADALMSSGHTMVEVPHLVTVASGRYRPETRSLMLAVLANLGLEAEYAVPKLWPLLEDHNAHVRLFAASAILEITQEPSLAGSLARHLGRDHQQRKAYEDDVLTQFKEREAYRREQLDALLEDPDDFVPTYIVWMKCAPGPGRRAAMRGLADLGPAAKSAIPELRRQLCSGDSETRVLAMRVLLRIEPRFATPHTAEKPTCGTGRQTRFGTLGVRRRCLWRNTPR